MIVMWTLLVDLRKDSEIVSEPINRSCLETPATLELRDLSTATLSIEAIMLRKKYDFQGISN